jgi:hypothetical protein
MERKLRIYVNSPRRPLRLPPDYHSHDKLNGDRMIGAVLVGIAACVVMGVLWRWLR